MKRFEIAVTQTVVVELDETKFTPVFMADFPKHFYDFHCLREHAEHIAQLHARGITNGFRTDFIEGYGTLEEMGITVEIVDSKIETERES